MKELIARLKKLSGTEKYVLLVQAASLLPLLYFIIGSGEAVTYTSEGILSFLFGLGMAFLSRAEVTCLSLLYRSTGNELLVYFAILAAALVFGLVMKRLLGGEERTRRITEATVFIFVVIDIVIRTLPIGINAGEGPQFMIPGLLFRALCLFLTGIRFIKKENR